MAQLVEYGARIGVIGVVSETPFEGLDGAVELPLVIEQQAEVVTPWRDW